VLQASGPNALGIIRSLAREDVPVVAVDHDPRALGLVSRHNLPLAAYLDAVGTPREWPAGHRDGIRWMLATRHLTASPREVLRGEWGAREFLSSLRPPIHDGVLDVRDPRPAIALARRHLRRLRGR
jgi:hypothetical protein